MIKHTLMAFLLIMPLAVQPAGAFDEIQALEKPVLESFARGDYPALYDSLARMLTARPDHPVSVLYIPDLLRLADVFGPEKVLQTVNTMIQNLGQMGDIKTKGSILFQLTLLREELLYQKAPAKGRVVTDEISPVRSWSIAGPFVKYGPGDLFYPFMPEKTMELSDTGVLQKNIVIKNQKGTLDLKEHLYPERGAAYASTSFSIRGKTRIRIYSDSLYKVFINGTERTANTREGFRRTRILEISGAENITLTLKILAGDSWSARVILTDENDGFISPKFIENVSFRVPCDVAETEEYPYYALVDSMDRDPRMTSVYLGNYFSEIEPRKSLEYFDRALAIGDDPAARFFSAAVMIRLAGSDRNSSLYARGWRAVREISSSHPDFIPARAGLLERDPGDMDIVESSIEGEKLIALCPGNYQAYDSYAALLRELELEIEFNRLIDKFIAAFPDSPAPYLHRAVFYSGKDLSREIAALDAALGKKYIPEVVRGLIAAYMNAGDYVRALALIKKYDRDDIFSKEAIAINIKQKDFKKARDLLLREVVRRTDPDYYQSLGRLNSLERIDPTLYWLKTLDLDSSRFVLSDYMDYLAAREVSHSLKNRLKVLDPWKEGNSLPAEKSSTTSVSILSRERVIRIYHDGASRALCRDIVKINDENGAQEWGEYRLPYEGKIIPVTVRVYSAPDEFTENFRVHSVDGESFISIGSLKKGCVLEMVYSAEEIFDRERWGMMLEHPLTLVQDYEEPVQNYRLDVICPPDMNLSFMIHPDLLLGQGFDGENKVYTVSGSELPARHREYGSGPAENVLPFFTFTAMKDVDDITNWYKGILSGTGICSNGQAEGLVSGAGIEETVKRVHGFVTEKITLEGNRLSLAEKAEDTLFNKRGTAQDRAVLARTLLEKLGITSYLALARSINLPDPGTYLSFGIFTDVLLYVPLDREKGLWIDFSSDNIPCGMVRGPLAGARALVLLSKGHDYKQISAKTINDKECTINLAIDEYGNAEIDARVSLTGPNRSIDKYFKNKLYQEETVCTYLRAFFPSIEISDYSIGNLKDPGIPLIIIARGKNNGLTVTGKNKMILKPVIIPSDLYRYISSLERKAPLIIEESVIENDEYRFTLPESCKNAEVNENYRINSAYGSAEIRINKKNNSRELSVIKKIIVPAVKIKPQDYHGFLQFCLDLKKIEYLNITINYD